MKTINATEYNAYDSKHRVPNTRVYVQRSYDSLPFDGKKLQTTATSEKYPKHILHSAGRLCIVYSKFNASTNQYDVYYKSSNNERSQWNLPVEVIQNNFNDYDNPTLIQLSSSNDIGIIVSQNSTDLYSCTINAAGTVQTALSDTTINGETPSLAKIGSTYWLTYERSGVIYYRTSTDFITWSAEVNFNTITGLTNNHYNPYIYYDTSDKLWITFERVTDATASPEVINAYTMLSNNDGSTWDAPVAQTTLTAGEGNALTPSIVDTGDYRYVSYTIQRTIQNLMYNTGAEYLPRFFQEDSVNSRIGMIHGSGTAADLVIYDRGTGLYTVHDLAAQGLSSGSVSSLAYDEVNQLWAIGTSANGLIIFDEITTTWTQYNKTTTPALAGIRIYSDKMSFVDKKLYFIVSSSTSYPKYIQKLDLNTNTISTLKDISTVNASTPRRHEIYTSAQYIVVLVRCRYNPGATAPFVFVFDITNDTELYSTTLVQTGYVVSNPDQTLRGVGNISAFLTNSSFGFDDVNNRIYCNASPDPQIGDNGIIVFSVGSSALSFVKYYSQLTGNPTGLLPNPKIDGDIYTNIISFIKRLSFNSTNNRLYIESYIVGGSAPGGEYYSVLNLDTDLVIETYAMVGDVNYASYFPVIDSAMTKVLPAGASFATGATQPGFINTDDKEVIYGSYTGNPLTGYAWHILTTESTAQRVYYRRTNDDITWIPQSYLTSYLQDSDCNLGYSNGRLKAFWNRPVDGVTEIRWDEDMGAEVNISQYVESIERDMTIENESNKCSIVLSDTSGLFNPLNYNSLYHDYLDENNIIRIEKGNNTNYEPYFYGQIGTGDSEYVRGEGIFYNITVWDKSKNHYTNKITTVLYQDKTITQIANDVAANYMELSALEYNFPTITTVIPQVQFIEESPMDILNKIFQIELYYADFDEEGILTAKEINYDASTDFTYYEDGTDTIAANKASTMNIKAINFSWDDNQLINKVTVIGQEEATEEEEFAEEFMGTIQGVAGWFSKRNQFEFYYSNDKKLYATQPRLVVQDSCGNKFFGGGESITVDGGDHSVKKIRCLVNQNVSNLIAAIFVLIFAANLWMILYGSFFGLGSGVAWVYNGLATVTSLAFAFLGQIGSYYYEIYAKPIGEPIPDTIIYTASDTDLINRYNGENELEIDNPLISTLEKCTILGDSELQKAKWFRYNIRLEVCANMAIQTGDVITLYNPSFLTTHKIYVREISSTYRRGSVDIDEITGALIT